MITLFVVISLLIDGGAADDALTSKEADVGLSTGIKNTNTHIIEESSDVDDNFCSIVKLQCDHLNCLSMYCTNIFTSCCITSRMMLTTSTCTIFKDAH